MEEDYLGYRMQSMSKPLTKRGLLSMLSSVYDPLGLPNPFILGARRIVQDLWRGKIAWDEKNQHESSRAVDMMGEWTSTDGDGQDLEVHPSPEPRWATAASLLGTPPRKCTEWCPT